MEPTRPVPGASVLLNFRAENSRSFRDGFELSLLATAMSDEGVPREVHWREGGSPIRVLPAACIFGANASGKSNVLRAMEDMRGFVVRSFRSGDPSAGLARKPFVLDPSFAQAPTTFEADLVLEGVRVRYGFKIDDWAVIDEWAYRYPKGRSALIFQRSGLDVTLGAEERARGRVVAGLLRSNALFLSTAAAVGHPTLQPLYEWFQRNLWLAEASGRRGRLAFTAKLLEGDRRDQVLALLRAADLGIANVRARPLDPETRERWFRAARVLMGREDEPEGAAGADILPPLDSGLLIEHATGGAGVDLEAEDESLGTLVWLGLVGPVVEALANGSVLLADELESSLHPALVAQLTLLFQDPATNPKRAQLIFNSHEATLLGEYSSQRVLGRDQIWFTEKGHGGTSRLYPLTDMEPRKQEAIGQRYLAGRYGAAPIVSREEFAAAAGLT